MKVKRYFAANMRSALDMVKQEQGPDVLILSNRKVEGGVELVTADELTEQEAARLNERPSTRRSDVEPAKSELSPATEERASVGERVKMFESDDYLWTDDNTMQQMKSDLASLKGLLESQLSGLAWSDFDNRHPLRARLLRVLARIGIAPVLARQLVGNIADDADYQTAWHEVLAVMMSRLQTPSSSVLEAGGRIAVLGPTGVGKSTLVSKLAARYALQHGPESVVIVSMDDRRLGAHQQMKTFGRLIGVAVYPMRDCDELAGLLDTASNRPMVLIDTPGCAPHDQRFSELVLGLDALASNIQMLNVISATTDYLATSKMLAANAELALDACVLTKLDEAASLGPSLSSIIEAGLPLAYTTAGQRVPDDLDAVDPRALIENAVNLAKDAPQCSETAQLEQAFSA